MHALIKRMLGSGLLALAAGCGSVGYYAQAVQGHFALIGAARPLEQWLADPSTPPSLRERLERAQHLRAFAARELALPDNASYTSYAELGRSYAVWNVFAAAEFSVEP
jgi:predicted aminopeptidase